MPPAVLSLCSHALFSFLLHHDNYPYVDFVFCVSTVGFVRFQRDYKLNARDTAQELRAFVLCVDDWNPFLCTQVRQLLNCLYLQLQEIQCSLLVSIGTYIDRHHILK